jgi:hypothetical protein
MVGHGNSRLPCLFVLELVIKKFPSQAWWCTPVILALKRLRQEDHKFETLAGCCWLTPIILATQEAGIRKLVG